MKATEVQKEQFFTKYYQRKNSNGLKWHQVYGWMKLNQGDKTLKLLRFKNRKEREIAMKNLREETVNYPEKDNLFITITITRDHD